MAEKTFTQLVAPGVTPAVDVDAVNNHVFQIKLANKDTSVDVNLEGSLDGTNFFKIKAADVQYTTDGMYYLTETDLQVKLDKQWENPDYSLRHDYTGKEHHEIHEKADLWNKLIKEIKSFQFIQRKQKAV